MAKYVFITEGSSRPSARDLRGVFGRAPEEAGFVSIIKLDPYLNVDAGP